MWAYLKWIYHQDNSIRRFLLESKIAHHTQGDKSVQDIISVYESLDRIYRIETC